MVVGKPSFEQDKKEKNRNDTAIVLNILIKDILCIDNDILNALVYGLYDIWF